MGKNFDIEKEKAECLERMKAISQENDGDPESTHRQAGDVLCDLLIVLGHNDIVDIFYELERWYA